MVQAISADLAVLLRGPALNVSAGCELLRPDLSLDKDISDDLAGGTIARNMFAVIHGTCTLELSRELRWGVDLVRPYMVLSDGLRTARVNVGVFCLTTPEREVGQVPTVFSVQGFDRVMLLDRQVGATYTIAAGTTYRQALLDAFAAAGLTGALIEGSAADSTLPAAKVYPLVGRSTDPDQTNSPVTYLRIINDLLGAINFRGVFADENGVFRCVAYLPPVQRAVEYTFDAEALDTIMGEERTVVADVWATPNRWVFRQTNRATGAPTPTEGDGIYTWVNKFDGPTSVLARGLTWTAVVDYEAASQAKLVELGDRKVAADRSVTTVLKYSTGPFPVAGHADVFTVNDAAAGLSVKVQASAWSFGLDGSDVEWSWQAVA